MTILLTTRWLPSLRDYFWAWGIYFTTSLSAGEQGHTWENYSCKYQQIWLIYNSIHLRKYNFYSTYLVENTLSIGRNKSLSTRNTLVLRYKRCLYSYKGFVDWRLSCIILRTTRTFSSSTWMHVMLLVKQLCARRRGKMCWLHHRIVAG